MFTRLLHGCLLNYYYYFFLCNCKELLLWLFVVALQTYISSYVSTPGLSRHSASFVSVNSFYLERQSFANGHGFKRSFGQWGMISLFPLIRRGLSWCSAWSKLTESSTALHFWGCNIVGYLARPNMSKSFMYKGSWTNIRADLNLMSQLSQ